MNIPSNPKALINRRVVSNRSGELGHITSIGDASQKPRISWNNSRIENICNWQDISLAYDPSSINDFKS